MGGWRAKDDIRITCGGEAKKSTFNDDIISGQPLIGSIELEGVDTKNLAHRTWGVYAFIWGRGGEVSKFKFKVGGGLD